MVSARYLDALEESFRTIYFFSICRYEGTIDIGLIRTAFKKLYSRYPALVAQIIKGEDGYLIKVPSSSAAKFIELRGGERDLLSAIQYQDHARGLSRFVLVEGDGYGYTALQLNHAVFDGASMIAMIRELWEIYAALAEGREIDSEIAGRLPLPPSHFMEEFWNDTDRSYQKSVIPALPPLDLETGLVDRSSVGVVPSHPLHRRISLNREETSSLVNAARKAKTSVHAIVCGTIVVVLRGRGNPEEPLPMACYSTVDIRNRVVPPIGPTETALVDFRSRAQVNIRAACDPVGVGHEIKAQLDEDINRRLGSPRLPSESSGAQDCADSDFGEIHSKCGRVVYVGNAGVIRRFSGLPNFGVVDFRMLGDSFVEPYIGNQWPSCTVSTYDGVLSVEGDFPGHLFEQRDVDAVADELLRLLRKIGAEKCVVGDLESANDPS